MFAVTFLVNSVISLFTNLSICDNLRHTSGHIHAVLTILFVWDFRFSQQRVWRWLSSWTWRLVVSLKQTDVSEACTASIITLIMEAVRSSETSIYFNDMTRCYICKAVVFYCGCVCYCIVVMMIIIMIMMVLVMITIPLLSVQYSWCRYPLIVEHTLTLTREDGVYPRCLQCNLYTAVSVLRARLVRNRIEGDDKLMVTCRTVLQWAPAYVARNRLHGATHQFDTNKSEANIRRR
jgi:hypothetical protein